MKKEVRLLLEKAADSLILSTEHFNRPWDRGRVSTVLILLDHAFEMLLKAAILHRGGRIREPRAKLTIGFDHCVRKALTDGEVKFLTKEQALTMQMINNLRDAAQHHLLDISEEQLYMQTQAGLTLFRDLYAAVFGRDLKLELPERVLPISTTPPADLATLFDREVKAVRRLLEPGKRRHIEAQAKLRALAIAESSIQGEKVQPSKSELDKLGQRIHDGAKWDALFPGVASVDLTSTGYGPSLDLRITKKKGIPIQLVKEGTPGAGVVAVKRVDELQYYSLSHTKLAQHVGLTAPKTTAMVRHLKLQEDPECFKEIAISKSKFNRYSAKAIERIKDALETVLIAEVWETHRPRKKTGRR
jgi:hypothetical protein